MGWIQLPIAPGIDVEKTPLLNEGAWSAGSGVRFFQGLVQKRGGWAQISPTACVGTVRGMHAWADNSGNPYLALGSEQRLQLYSGGAISDITPIRSTKNVSPSFTTVSTQTSVKATDNAHGAALGDWINMPMPVSVGGLILQGFYQVASVLDANNYTIMAASAATGSVTNGGAVPSFTTVNTSPVVTVNFANHGLVAGNTFNTQFSVTVGGITIPAGTYAALSSGLTTNAFQINPGVGNATSAATVSENGGNVQIQYLIASGTASAYSTSGGPYSSGLYGAGEYGTSGTTVVPVTQWFLDHFGAFLIGNRTGSPIYIWEPPPAYGNVAIPVNTTNFPGALQPPTTVNVSFMSAPQQMLIALGCDTPGSGVYNPLLVRWCDAGDFTDWQALSTNQAGSYPIASGSRLVGGISAPNFVCIWTDVDMWLMNYLGGTGLSELVWGFNKITGGRGLLAARAVALVGTVVYFASPNGFFSFNGARVTPIQCPVWDIFWQNLLTSQVDKVTAAPNSQFTEVSWHFPSATGNGENDSVITLNTIDNTWTYDIPAPATPLMASNWTRTAWVDQNVYGAPIGVDTSKLIQQAETGYDANGMALPASVTSGWFAVSEGTYLTTMERLAADLKVIGGAQTVYVTITAQDDPDGVVRTYGPYPWILGSPPPATPYSVVRARGRFMQVQIASTGLGVFWRVGRMRYYAQQKSGRRP